MKYNIFIIILFLLSMTAYAQPSQYTPMTAQGYQFKRILTDSTLHLPSFCGVPTLRNSTAKNGALAVDTCNNRLYQWTNSAGWSIVGGTTIDTTSLSNRINTKIDSLKRSTDSIFAKKNGTWIFQYKDSTGGSTPSLQQVTDVGATTTNTITATNLYSVTTEYNKPELNGINVNTYPYYTTDGGVIPQQSYSLLPITGNQEPIIYNGGNASGYNKITPNYYESSGSALGTVVQIIPTYTNSDNHYLPISDNQTDTLATLADVAAKVNINDTGSMLLPYLRKIDSIAMLNPYLQKIDTTNKWVTSVTKVNDSTIRVVKYNTTTDIVITPSATVTAATRLVTTVYNNSGTTITKGSVVYINGRHSSNLPTIALAQANSEQTSYATFALVQDDILNNNSGTVIQAGKITNLNLPTATYTDGDIVYLSATTAGGITNNKSSVLAPNHIVKLGTVTRAHPTFGGIEIKIENGWQLDELSDVQIPAVPNDSTLLQFSRVDSLWHAVSVNNAIGTKYLKPSDTATMLTPYLRSNIATATYLAKSDTATMLTPYLRSNIATATYLAKSDTATMLTPYLRSNIAAATYLAKSDTATMLTPYLRSNIAAATYQGALTLTTTGTSGAATLVGNTLNIPQYSGGSSYTFSTGLTNTAGTVTNNLSTGIAGGQSVIGGTAASNSLTLSSTSNATKGKILFGTSAYDEVNNRLGIGTASPSNRFHLTGSTTASAGTAVIGLINPTITAAANNDTLTALYVNPTYSVGSFTNTIQLSTRINGNVLMGQSPGNIYTYPPLTLCNNLNANLKTQLSLVNGGGNAGAGSAIDFFTYTDAGNGNPGVRIGAVDDGNFTANYKIYTKNSGSSGNGSLVERFQIVGNSGNVLIGTTSNAGYKLDVNGTARASQFYLSALNTAPASAAATGTTGEIRIDANYIYICTATNTWKRVAISTW